MLSKRKRAVKRLTMPSTKQRHSLVTTIGSLFEESFGDQRPHGGLLCGLAKFSA